MVSVRMFLVYVFLDKNKHNRYNKYFIKHISAVHTFTLESVT